MATGLIPYAGGRARPRAGVPGEMGGGRPGGLLPSAPGINPDQSASPYAAKWLELLQSMPAGMANSLTPEGFAKFSQRGIKEFEGGLTGDGPGGKPLSNIERLLALFPMALEGAGFLSKVPPGAFGTGAGRTAKGARDPLLWHEVGAGKKLTRPVDEMTAEVTPLGNMSAKKKIDIADLQGSVIIPAPGDRSIAGGLLTTVNETPLTNPVKLHGGPDFMRTHADDGEIWASGQGVISNLLRRGREAGAGGQDVHLAYTPMTSKSLEFNTMMSDALIGQIAGSRITKKSKKAFDSQMRKLDDGWPGLDAPNLGDVLRSAPGSGMRTMMVREMSKPHWTAAGFPDVSSTRKAITEPGLLNSPMNSTGYAFGKMDPEGLIIKAPAKPHPTYDTHMGGDYIGGLGGEIPRDIMYRDWSAARLANRPAGFNPANTGDNRSFQRSDVSQTVDQELVDTVSEYLRRRDRR